MPLLLLLVIGATTLVDAAVIDMMRTQRAADIAADRGVGPTVVVRPAAARQAIPVRVVVPRLRLSSPLVHLRKNKDNTLQVPARYDRAGWYVGSARPGDAGPTVLAGHVDSKEGPGVFHGLRGLRRGDVVVVERKDRSKAEFVVTRVERVAKRAFPTARVYGGDRPELRLITCGGVFDARSGRYRDNVIVYASLRRPG